MLQKNQTRFRVLNKRKNEPESIVGINCSIRAYCDFLYLYKAQVLAYLGFLGDATKLYICLKNMSYLVDGAFYKYSVQ